MDQIGISDSNGLANREIAFVMQEAHWFKVSTPAGSSEKKNPHIL